MKRGDAFGKRRSVGVLRGRLDEFVAGEPAREVVSVEKGLVTSLGHDSQVVQVLEKLIVLGDREHDGCASPAIVGLVLSAS